MFMTSPRQRGFTLIELIIFIVVVGAGLAGILSVSTNAIKSSADPLIRKQTVAVAESLLEEILQKDYAKPTGSTATGFSAGGARNLYDCVDDYDTYNTTAGIVRPDAAATPVVGLENYNISAVSVAIATAAESAELNAISAKRITVTVTGPQGPISLTGYRSNY
jgi:MSHA pilin protein MshD